MANPSYLAATTMLGQILSSGIVTAANTPTAVYTVPSNTTARIATGTVCNTSGTARVVSDGVTTGISAPTGFTATPVGSGGSFAAAAYFWKITATNASGETVGSTEATATIVLNGSATLGWTAVSGATGYKIYRSTTTGGESGASSLVTTIGSGATVSYTDTGSATTTGAVPTVGTAGSTTVTSATANFTAADVGKAITGNGIQAGTTISSVTNATTVVLSVAATATATGVALTYTATAASVVVSAAILKAADVWDGTHQFVSGYVLPAGETLILRELIGGAMLATGEAVVVMSSAPYAVAVVLTGAVSS